MPISTLAVNEAINTLNTVRKPLRNEPNKAKSAALVQISADLAVHIFYNSVRFKHPAYKEEKEVRLLVINEMEKLLPYIKIRARGNDVVPYIEYKFTPNLTDPGAVDEIHLGPASSPILKRGLVVLLNSAGYPRDGVITKVPIKTSVAPYRAL